MKKITALLLSLIMLLALTACGGSEKETSSGTSAPGDNTGKESSAETKADEEWQIVKDEYSDLTMDELYEKAKAEGGVVRIYATTADANTAARKFVKDFPDIQVEYISQDTDQVSTKIEMEAQSGNVNADVLMVKDNTGEIYHNMVLGGMLSLYYPTVVCEHIDKQLLRYGLPLYATFNPWYYNTEKYPDGCPIKSWWDIVEGYDVTTGKFTDQKWTIYTKDITGPSYTALWTQLIIDGDKVAEQYEKQYGEPLVYTYNDKLVNVPGILELPENNGGVELFYRFSQMSMTELADGDAVVQAVDESLNGPTLGLKLSNKLNAAWVTGLEPYTAFQACCYTYIVNGCDNPAAARLFVLYCMSGAEGETGCYMSFDKKGSWSVRDDIQYTKNDKTKEEVNLTAPDFEEIYMQCTYVQAYWTKWHADAK